MTYQNLLLHGSLSMSVVIRSFAATPTFDGGILIEHPHPEYSKGCGAWTG